jgi:MoaA/NifB/PqqE/SkfB family radical SAM enzyme
MVAGCGGWFFRMKTSKPILDAIPYSCNIACHGCYGDDSLARKLVFVLNTVFFTLGYDAIFESVVWISHFQGGEYYTGIPNNHIMLVGTLAVV